LPSSFSGVDYAQEEILIQEAGDNEDLCKGHLLTALVLSYKACNYWLQGLRTESSIDQVNEGMKTKATSYLSGTRSVRHIPAFGETRPVNI
jgi:hypothetical protein